MIANKYFYIYSPQKANFFLQNGIQILEVGTGRVDGAFFKFLKTEKSLEVSQRWKELNGYEND